jgi:hypothetical protein
MEEMKKCPRFETCSIPICPLDPDKEKRLELKGEAKCILYKLLGERRTKRMEGNITPKMRSLLSFIR